MGMILGFPAVKAGGSIAAIKLPIHPWLRRRFRSPRHRYLLLSGQPRRKRVTDGVGMAISNKIGLSSDEIRHGVAGALSVLKTWAITDQQILSILGARDLNELKNWVTGQVRAFPADLPLRIGLVSGIHTTLSQRTRDKDHAAHWLGKPNASLEGKRPIDVMTGGNIVGLMLVRDHLRGGSSR
jgi:hypothetical protein